MSNGLNRIYLRRLYDTEIIKLDNTVFGVYKLIAQGRFNFAQIFGKLGDLNRLCFTVDLIDQFCLVHRNKILGGGDGNFFLYKEGEKFSVVVWYTQRYSDYLCYKDRYQIEENSVWDGRHRDFLIVPMS